MFKGNMSKLLKQAQEMQTQIEEVQNQLSDMIMMQNLEAEWYLLRLMVNKRS